MTRRAILISSLGLIFEILAMLYAAPMLISSNAKNAGSVDHVQAAPLIIPDTSGPAAQNHTTTPIKHFVVVMQENHSFDNYFGTYPGAEGLTPDTQMPVDPNNPAAGYVTPWHIGDNTVTDLSHSPATFDDQYNEGDMNGFVAALNQRNQDGKLAMGYYDDRDIPYYWNLADKYVLFDRFFSSAKDGSFVNHMYWAAGVSPVANRGEDLAKILDKTPTIFDRLQEKGVSWKFYVQNYDPNITYRTASNYGNRASQVIWVPLLNIPRFIDNPVLSSHIVDLKQYYEDTRNGTLPEVSFIVPSGASEHPPSNLASGQRFIRTLIQELMRSKHWESSAFLLLYDDWGGWYDHVRPPMVDAFGYGLRVPGILVSPYAREGYIDSTVLDFTSVLKFIEENWGVAPLADRDAKASNFLSAFDFNQAPRKADFVPSTRVDPLQAAVRAEKSPAPVIYTAYGVALLLSSLAFGLAYFRSRRKPRRLVEGDLQA